MLTQQFITIATFAIAILGIVFAFGIREAKINNLEADVKSLTSRLNRIESRIDRISEFAVRMDQRIAHLQEAAFGTEKTERMRESAGDENYKTISGTWKTDNPQDVV